MVGRGPPRVLQKLHPAELLKRRAAPVGRGPCGFQSALALSALLVHSTRSSPARFRPAGADKQPKSLVINGFYWLLAGYGRPHEPIDILNSLDPCSDNAHSSSH